MTTLEFIAAIISALVWPATFVAVVWYIRRDSRRRDKEDGRR